MPTAERILLIRPSALGDVCRSVPLLASLRRAYPAARIDWLVQDAFVDAVAAHPDLNNAVPFPRKTLGRQLRTLRWGRVLDWIGDLRHPRYNLVIDAQGLLRSGLISYFCGAPTRVGDRAAAELAWLFYNTRIRTRRESHTVDRMLALLDPLEVPRLLDLRLYTPPAGTTQAAELLGDGAIPYILLAPTSRWPGKRWPADRFAELALALFDAGVPRIVLVGGPGEESQCRPLLDLAAHDPRILNCIGRTTVAGLMALVERAALVIANDSAPVHMAVGFHRSLVALYGPTDVSRVGPCERSEDVLQHLTPADRFDHKNHAHGQAMMQRISTQEVLQAALQRWPAPSPART